MKLAIMQPYLFPYLGYFQLIYSADVFVIYDNIKYTKKGWINRNRILSGNSDAMISLPLKSDSDSLEIKDRRLATDYSPRKLLNQLRGTYGKAPHFSETYQLLERVFHFSNPNLFDFLHNSIVETCRHLEIETEIKISSEINADHGLKSEERVISICRALSASTYVNAIGGTELYSRDRFAQNNLELKFNKPKLFVYPQFGKEFVPWLSIIDVLMFNAKDVVTLALRENFELVNA